MRTLIRFQAVALLAASLASWAHAQTTIPLVYVAEGSDPRLGIYANIGGAGNPDALSQLYLVDTGSPDFVSAAVNDASNAIYGYGGAWWGTVGTNYTYQGYAESGTVTTGSEQLGNLYNFAIAQATVTLSGATSYTTSQPITVNQGTSYVSGTTNLWHQWQTTDGMGYPPENHLFYGTFGSDLTDPTNGMSAVSANYANWYNHTASGSSSPVANGYVIQVRGGPNGSLATGTGATAQTFTTLGTASLTLGISQATMDHYQQNGILLPMQSGTNGSESYKEKLLSENYVTITITSTDGIQSVIHVATTLDTGEGGSPVLYNGSGTNALNIDSRLLNEDGTALKNGVTLTMSLTGTDGSDYTAMSLVQGGTMPYNSDSASNGINITLAEAGEGEPASFNASLAIFQLNDVMFNMSTGQVGFLAVPEPSPLGLMLGGVISLGVALGLALRKELTRSRGI